MGEVQVPPPVVLTCWATRTCHCPWYSMSSRKQRSRCPGGVDGERVEERPGALHQGPVQPRRRRPPPRRRPATSPNARHWRRSPGGGSAPSPACCRPPPTRPPVPRAERRPLPPRASPPAGFPASRCPRPRFVHAAGPVPVELPARRAARALPPPAGGESPGAPCRPPPPASCSRQTTLPGTIPVSAVSTVLPERPPCRTLPTRPSGTSSRWCTGTAPGGRWGTADRGSRRPPRSPAADGRARSRRGRS